MYLVPLCLLLAGGGIYYSKSQNEEKQKKGSWGSGATPVIVATAQIQTFTEIIEALGTVKANESTMLSPPITGIVAQIDFEEGQSVEAGKVLIQLEKDEEQAYLREAQAMLKESERQLQRVRQLENSGGISQSTVDEALTSYEASLAQVSSLETQLNEHLLRAPFSGIVGLRNISLGTLIRPGDPVLSIMDISSVKLDFTIPEAYLSMLKTGQTIKATSIAYPDQVFTGTVQSIDSQIDVITRALTVRAVIPNQNLQLLPGMLMTVDLATIEKQSIAIPESALVPIGGKQYVFLVDENKLAKRILVEIGNRTPGQVEITKGLQAGDIVISEGFRARHGKPVEIKQPDSIATPASSPTSSL